MALGIGIIGLPNVGKSTLFNALLKKQVAFVANYPFATIEPNIGVVPVPDERLDKLAEIEREENKMAEFPPKVPATVKFVDIAGLVKGANEGAGLGNKFLSHIREVSVIAHVVRAFTDENVIKEGSIDVKTDYETINTELMLADLQSLEKSKGKAASSAKASVDKQKSKGQKEVAEKIFQSLNKGIPARCLEFNDEERAIVGQLFLLSAKPEIIVLNVSEEDYTQENIPKVISKYSAILNPVIASNSYLSLRGMNGMKDEAISRDRHASLAMTDKEIVSSPSSPRNDNMVVICAKIEAELAELTTEEQKEYLKDLGFKQSGLERLTNKAYGTLNLISFLTAGEKEVRAWTIEKGAKAVEAAGVIHTDFIKNFIKAEAISFNDFVGYHGWKGAREKGKTRFEGKDYIMQDGDIVEFKIGK